MVAFLCKDKEKKEEKERERTAAYRLGSNRGRAALKISSVLPNHMLHIISRLPVSSHAAELVSYSALDWLGGGGGLDALLPAFKHFSNVNNPITVD